MLRKKNNFVIERYKNKTVLKVECFDKKEGHCGWISPTFYDHALPGALEFGHRNQKPAVEQFGRKEWRENSVLVSFVYLC